MKLEGYDVILNKNMTYRFSDGNDKDINGDPIPDGYIVFIRLSDCKIVDDGNGRTYYDCESSPIIPIEYLDSWYGVGETKRKKVTKPINIDDQLVNEYNHSTIYFAYNGMVYTGSLNEIIY